MISEKFIFTLLAVVLIILAIAVTAFILFWFGFGLFGFLQSCKRRKSDNLEKNDFCGGKVIPEDAKEILFSCRAWLDEVGGEDIYIKSRDRLKLHGRLITHGDAPRPLVIFFHGYHSSCRRDLAIQSKGVFDEGYDILLVSQRGHGKSGGRYLCFGTKERYDALAWCNYAKERFGDIPMALMGLSMGGATVMMASALPLPENIKCIIDDCGFTSPLEVTVNTLVHRAHVIPYPTVYFMNFWCMLLAGFRLGQISTLKALKENTRPLLIIHGELDTYVPTEMSLRNAKVNEALTELVVFSGAKHAQSVYYHRDGYIQKLTEFLGKYMKSE